MNESNENRDEQQNQPRRDGVGRENQKPDYEDENEGKTKPIQGRTVPMADTGFTKVSSGGTRIANDECDNEMDFLPDKVDFTGQNGRHYTVDFSRELGRGGEAVVVVAYDDSGQEFAAKIYSLPQSRREQRNHNAVLEFLSARSNESIESYRITHLMPLLEYGTITATLIGEERPGEFNVTIMPKCNCLGNERLSKNDIKRRIIPSLAEALKVLHDQNIVHRDVKPSNVYEYNGTVVLGDYGISTVLDKDANLKDTHTNRGTAGYWLPLGYVEPKGDWYSLGYTIWTMYNGNVHPHQDRIDAGNLLGDVYAGRRVVPFEPVDDADIPLRDLVYGLTTVYADKRLGYEDIQRWIKAPNDFEFEDPSNEETGGWRHKYTFDNIKIDNGSKLAEALSGNWNYAIQHLFDGNDLIEHFSRNGENDISTKLRVIVREFAGTEQDLGMAEAIYIISGSDARMTWRGQDASFPTLVSEFASKSIDSLESYDSLFQSGFLSWTLCEGGLDLAGIDANTVGLVEDASKKNPRYARSLFQQLFAGGGDSEYAGFKESDELVKALIENPQNLYSIMGDRKELEACVAALAPFYTAKGRLDRLVTSINLFEDSPISNMNNFLLLLEELDEKGVVPKFAMTYGPVAPWFWVGQNAAQYEVRSGDGSEKAKRAIESFGDFETVGNTTVGDIVKQGDEAKFQADIIRQEMDPSPVPSYLGIHTEKTVVAKCDDAYFCGSFYGCAVPRGFVRQLATAPGVDLSNWAEVSLLSKDVQNESGYLGIAQSLCDDNLAKCEKAESESGGKALSVLRFILDIALVLVVILVAPALSEVLAPMAASFLGLFNGTLAMGDVFTQVTVSMLCFAFAYDGVISFWLAKRASTIAAAKKEIEQAKNKLEKEAVDFQTGSSGFAKELKDLTKNDSHTSARMTESLEAATADALSVSAQSKSYLYMVIWHAAAVIGVAYCVIVALVVLVPFMDIPPWITILLIFAGIGVVYGLACWRLGKPGSQMYTSYGLLGMIATQLCTTGVVVLLIFLVMAAIAAVLVIGIPIAVLVGLLSS